MSMAKTYMQIENTFREKYRNAIERRLEKLEEADDKLDELQSLKPKCELKNKKITFTPWIILKVLCKVLMKFPV